MAGTAETRRGSRVVIAAFFVMFTGFGCAYSFSSFFAPLQESFASPRGDLSLVFSIATSLYFLLGVVSGPLADRFGPRFVVLFGVAIIGLGLFAVTQAQTLWQVYWGYGLGVGVGVGFAYVPAVGAVQRWFVRRRGLASGLAVSGIGAGTLVMPLFAVYLIDHLGWRGAYGVLGAVTLLGGGTAALFIDGTPERHGPKSASEGMTLAATLRTKPFWMIYLATLAVSFGLFLPFVHLTPFAEDHGIAHDRAVGLFSLMGIGSTAGRFALGGLADRFGRRVSLASMHFGMALSLGWWTISTEAWQIALFALVFGSCYGGFVALSPALLADYFGSRNAAGIVGASYTSVAIGTLFGPTLAGYAFDLFRSYTIPIAGSAGACLIGVLLILLLPKPVTSP
ncbi:MAG TPA: MFS transporter [Stellaceae bacterium]|nr:MFS transporter [Stellaceae bacterium]